MEQSDMLDTYDDDPIVRFKLLTYNERLVTSRKLLGYTQMQFSRELGVPIGKLSAVERLKENFDYDQRMNATALLNVSRNWLFPKELLDAVSSKSFIKDDITIGVPDVALLSEIPNILQLPDVSDSVDDIIDHEGDFDLAMQIIGELTPREQRVICLSFGLNGEEVHTLTDTGVIVGITIERVRQIREKALKRIRGAYYRLKSETGESFSPYE